eukprot:1419199-Prymnesium_polylepis.1
MPSTPPPPPPDPLVVPISDTEPTLTIGSRLMKRRAKSPGLPATSTFQRLSLSSQVFKTPVRPLTSGRKHSPVMRTPIPGLSHVMRSAAAASAAAASAAAASAAATLAASAAAPLFGA